MLSFFPQVPMKERSFEGFITEEVVSAKKFYLQDRESGAIIELKFIDEDAELLSFTEFGQVSVLGHYNPSENYIIVEEINETDAPKEFATILLTK